LGRTTTNSTHPHVDVAEHPATDSPRWRCEQPKHTGTGGDAQERYGERKFRQWRGVRYARIFHKRHGWTVGAPLTLDSGHVKFHGDLATVRPTMTPVAPTEAELTPLGVEAILGARDAEENSRA
jgi:hypothetical protein